MSDNVIQVSSSPHLSNNVTTKKVMIDVLISLIPVLLAALYFFRFYALKQVAVCLVSALFAEWLFTKMRGRKASLSDCSAAITGVILGLSLPATAPIFVSVIASFVAIGIGKIVFGGLGMNIFNPAMVGRAFVMISFASLLGAGGYKDMGACIDIISRATPMDAFKQAGIEPSMFALFFGNTNGSIGETSALACLIGGIYLCIKRVASWEIPLSIIITTIVWSAIAYLVNPAENLTVMGHLFGGALLFGAFFIATDPVTSPITKKGKLIFGVGVGSIIMLLRLFSGYPEGVMFAVLLMNAITPLINNWTIPKAFGEK